MSLFLIYFFPVEKVNSVLILNYSFIDVRKLNSYFIYQANVSENIKYYNICTYSAKSNSNKFNILFSKLTVHTNRLIRNF